MRFCHKLGAAVVCLLCVLTGRLSAGIVDLPDITVTSFGHGYSPAVPTDPLSGIADGVSFRGTQGTYSTTSFTGQFQNGDTVRQRIVAPEGFQFFVFHHPRLENEVIGAELDWETVNPAFVGDVESVNVTYDNVHGDAPTTVYSTAGVADSGEMVTFDFNSPVIGDFTFTSMTLEFTVGNSPTAGTNAFTLTSTNDPSFFALGVGDQASDATLLGLSPLPEPTGIVVAGLWGLGALGCRRFRFTDRQTLIGRCRKKPAALRAAAK